MKTVLDLEQMIFDILSNSPLKNEINGLIYKGGNISDFSKENVMIKAITTDGEQIQRGAANVNVYVPDVDVKVGGKVTKQPDNVRLKALSHLVVHELLYFSGEDYELYIEGTNVFPEPDGIDSHYVNFRIRFSLF